MLIILLFLVWFGSRIYLIIDNCSRDKVNKYFLEQHTSNNFTPERWEDEPNTPYYIEDEITAIYDQISVYNRLTDYYINELEYTSNIEKRLKLEKKISDLKYKCSKLENKVNKLLDKWEG